MSGRRLSLLHDGALSRLTLHSEKLLSVPLSIDRDIIRLERSEQRQITLSVNDLQISCRTYYSPLVA